MEHDLLDGADPARGRLRTFLLISFQSQLSHAAEAAAAQKRGGGREILSLEMETAEGRYQVDAIDSAATPEMVFDHTWARMMIQAAIERVGESYDAAEFKILRPFLTGGSEKDVSYADAAQALSITEDNARQKVSRLARRLPQALRAVVRESLSDPSEEVLDQETGQPTGGIETRRLMNEMSQWAAVRCPK
jgi:hypothetical protein